MEIKSLRNCTFSLLLCLLFAQVRISFSQSTDSVLYKLNRKIDHYQTLPRHEQIPYFSTIEGDINAILNKATNPDSIIYSKIRKAIAKNHTFKGEYNKAVPVCLSILENGTSLRDSFEIYSLLRKSYLSLNNLPKAFETQIKIDRMKRLHSEEGWISASRLSSLYYHFGMYREALNESKREFPGLIKHSVNDYFLAGFNNDMGLFYWKLGKIDSALYYFQRAEQFLATATTDYMQRLFFKGLIRGNIAQAIMTRGEYEKAIPLLKEDIKYSYLSKNDDNAAISHNELAQCYLKLKRYTAARVQIDSAYAIVKTFEAPKILLANRKLLVDLYKGLNKPAELLKAYDEFMLLEDSVQNLEKARNLINQQVIHELELNELENQEKQRIIEMEQLSNERYAQKQKIIIVILLMSLLLLGFLTFYIIKSREKRKELSIQYNKIAEQNQIIEAALHEKGFLLQEIHHRVKNNLQIISSLLRLQEDKVSNQDALESLSQSKRRIESMALIHQLLYRSTKFNEIEMDTYVEMLVSKIAQTFYDPDKEIRIDFKADPIKLHIDKAIPLGLIINEIVTNSFKYAFPNSDGGVLEVNLQKTDEKLCFTAKDNGSGFPPNYLSRKDRSLGLELIEILSAQLDAKLEIENKEGVTYKIIF